MEGCNSSKYIGFTTCSLKERFRTHTQNSSSIKRHLSEAHNINRTTTVELLKYVTVLHRTQDKRDLIFSEALFIKMEKPLLNSQNDFSNKILKVFKH